MKIFATPWATGKSFIVSQSVSYLGVAYICISAHTAGATFDATKFDYLDPINDNYWDPVRNSFYNPNFFAVDIVFLGLPNVVGEITDDTVLRLCNGGIDITVEGKTYTAQGDFIGFSTITEEFDVKVGKFQIHLSGLSTGMVDKFTGGVNAKLGVDYEGKRVQVAKCFLDYNTLEVITAPYIMFEGIIYNVSISENAVTCDITIDCSTLWADFDRTAVRMTNNASNWLFQKGNSTDRTFDKTSTVGEVEFKWGRA